tara:strand:- start:637 stop:879 length:243 start_codon:yes stop_codon:yes gene_type:complete
MNLGENTQDEEDIVDRVKAREIVQAIMDHGVNQNQIYQLIFLLSMELENHNHVKEITDLVKSIRTAKNERKSNIILEDKT